jgi:hypothetical protein
MWVEGRILDTKGNPIANAQIDTWETDENGLYDTQVCGPVHPDELLPSLTGVPVFRLASIPVERCQTAEADCILLPTARTLSERWCEWCHPLLGSGNSSDCAFLFRAVPCPTPFPATDQ